MTERHLREATGVDAEKAQADLIAAALLAEFGTPTTYERAHSLIALAYLRGSNDGVRWVQDKIGGAA